MKQNIASLALGGGVPSAAEVVKGMQGYGDQYNFAVPKTWFNDPYAMLDSMGLGYKAVPSTLSFETLRGMAEKNSIVAAIIQTRLNQVEAFCQRPENKYSVGYKIVPRSKDKKITESEQDYINKLEDFVQNMGLERNKERDTLPFWVKKVTRDRLRYDQLCAETVRRRNGKLHSVIAAPADTIRIATPKNKKGTPMTEQEQKYIPKFVQVIDGSIVNEYTRDEMIFRVSNPRTEISVAGYGYSELEMLITTVTAHLWAEEWNRKAFSQGATVKGILNVKGNVPPAQLEAFRRQWLTQVSGVINAWRTPVMNSDELQWIPLQPSNNEMGYSSWLEYLIKVACACYLIDPAEINFDMRAGVGQQPMFMTTNEAQQKVSKDRGLQPLLRFLQTIINEDILWEIDDRYRFAFVGLDARTESEAIELRLKELQSHKTLNEVREADGLKPVEHGDMVLNPVYVGRIGAIENQKMQLMQMQQQGQGGAPGGQQPGVGAPGGPKELFPELFKDQPKTPAADPDAQHLGNKISTHHGDDQVQPEVVDEGHRIDETTEDWEWTKHASAKSKRVATQLSGDLAKANKAFSLLE